jgi:Glycosyl hydrolase family 26
MRQLAKPAVAAIVTASLMFTAGPAHAGTTILFGANVTPHNGETMTQAAQREESELGHAMGSVRVFLNWDSNFPSNYHLWLRDTGHILFVSVRAKMSNGTVVPWASIAAAQPGSAVYDQIVGWATKFKTFGSPMYFIFNHEPESKANLNEGTSTDFIGAWQNIWNIFHAQGVTNLQYVWTMTDYAFKATDRRAAALWYPGDTYVDDIGADVYNWYKCRPTAPQVWETIAQRLNPMMAFGAMHPTKGLVLPEFASVENPTDPTAKATWIAQAEALFQQPGYQMFKAVMWFDSQDQNYPACVWYWTSSALAQSAIQVMAADPYFQANTVL